MIDFDRLVLRPAMAAFGRPIGFLPKHDLPFVGRGDFRRPTETVDLGEGDLTTAAPTLGIRASDFVDVDPPRQDDQIYVGVRVITAPPGFEVLSSTRRYVVKDVRPDGEGDIKLILAEISAP